MEANEDTHEEHEREERHENGEYDDFDDEDDEWKSHFLGIANTDKSPYLCTDKVLANCSYKVFV